MKEGIDDSEYQNIVAKKIAKLHTVTASEVSVDLTLFEPSIWPWDTNLSNLFLTQEFYAAAYATFNEAIIASGGNLELNITNADDFSQFCEDLVYKTDGPIVFRQA